MRRKFLLFRFSCIFMLSIMYSGFALASLPDFSKQYMKQIALKEKKILEDYLIEYNAKDYELEIYLTDLKMRKEWLEHKIQNTKDQKKRVPHNIEKAKQTLTLKIMGFTKEQKRVKNLLKKYISRLKKLNNKVKRDFSNRSIDWWRFTPIVSKLLGIEHSLEDSITETDISDLDLFSTNYGVERKGLKKELETKIKKYGLKNWVKLTETGSGLKLETRLPILFASGKISVSKDYRKFFDKLAKLLKPYKVKVEVRGFADKSKVKSKVFASNWDIASKRASSVVKELVKKGMDPKNFKVISKGAGSSSKKRVSAMDRRAEVRVMFL